MNVDWIKRCLEERGIPRARLIEAVEGMTHTKLSLVLNGHRKLTADEADQIRHFFGYRLPDDPPRDQRDLLQDKLAKLEDHQVEAVALYLKALLGSDPEQSEAG